MNHTFKRILSLALALVLVVSLVPSFSLTVSAASLNTEGWSNTDIGFGVDSNKTDTGAWVANGDKVTGTVKAKTGFKPVAQATTLTITNNTESDATLSFDYKVTNNGTVAVSAGNLTATNFSCALTAGSSVVVTFTSTSNNTKECKLTMTDVKLTTVTEATSTFLPAENGTYTVDGQEVTEATTMSKLSSENYTLAATPAEGYQFFGWYSETKGAYVSYDANTVLAFTEDPQLTAHFISDEAVLFGVGILKYQDLNDAIAHAAGSSDKTIVLLNGGTLSGSYTIPKGVTLLIPFDEENTCYRAAPAHIGQTADKKPNAWEQPYAYRTLTLAADATITVEGAISLSAKHSAGNGSGMLTAGSPSGAYGHIHMLGGSKITVADGGALYAWGYITGAGSVLAKDGAEIHENFQFTDFRGGSASMMMATSGMKVFPLSQYYVQNIEVPTTFEDGSKEFVYTSVFAANSINSAGVMFIGDPQADGSKAMFDPAEGSSITKTYDGTQDRLVLDVHGDAVISTLSLSVGGNAIDSSDFVLPINNNISINIHSGTTTVGQDMALLPGSTLTIDEGAELKLNYKETPVDEDADGETDSYTYGCNLFVYDRDEWFEGVDFDTEEFVTGKFVHTNVRMRALSYAPGRTYTRTEDDLKDVVLDINGTLTAEGFVYTTLGGASIISSNKTGKLVMVNGAGEEFYTVQANYVGGSDLVQYLALFCASAQLQNGDGSYTFTGPTIYDDEIYPAEPGNVFTYNADWDMWDLLIATVKFDANGGEGTMADQMVFGLDNNEIVLNANAFTKEGYVFAGWATSPDGEVEYRNREYIYVPEDTTLYAVWKEAETFDVYVYNEYGQAEYITLSNSTAVSGQNYVTTISSAVGTDLDVWGIQIKDKLDEEGWVGNGEFEFNEETHTLTIYDDFITGDLIIEVVPYVTVKTHLNGGSVSENWTHTYEPVDGVITKEWSVGKEMYIFLDWNDEWEMIPGANSVFVREGYTVVSYNTAADGSGTEYKIDELYSFTDDVELYLIWKANEYKLTWIVDGVTTTESVAAGTELTAPDAPEKEGYTFAGWEGKIPTTMPAEDTTITLTSKWEKNSYTVTWVIDGVTTTETLEYGAALSAPADPSKEGHTFMGWDGTIPTTVPAEDITITLTSKWTKNVYKLTWIIDGVSSAEAVAYGTALTAPAAPEKEGYTFVSWEGEIPTTMPAEDTTITLTSKWEKNTYTVTWIIDGVTTTETLEYGAALSAPADPSKEGHTFMGWDGTIPTTVPAEDITITLTSKWTKNVYKLTWIIDGVSSAEAVAYGTALTAPAAPEKEGYTFVSWEGEIPTTMPAEDITITLTSKWEKKTYTVTWVDENNEIIATESVKYGEDAVNTPAVPEKEGHTGAWEIDAVAVKSDLTIAPVYTVNTYKLTFMVSMADEQSGDIAWHEFTYEVAYGDNLAELIPETAPLEVNGTMYKGVWEFVEWTADGADEEAVIPATMPACDLEFYQYHVFTGWWTDDIGTAYYVRYEMAFGNEIGYVDGDAYLFENGYLVKDAGLVRTVNDEGVVEYYYFCDGTVCNMNGCDHGYAAVKNGVHWVENTNDYLPKNDYTFDENGVIKHHADTSRNGIFEDEDGVKCYYIDGVKAYMGLIEIDGDLYYVRSNGELVIGRTYWVSKTNGLVEKEGNYEFDENGKLVVETSPAVKTGIFEENGKLYYYEDGVKTYAGLIKIGEDYYYVKSNCEAVRGGIFWITKTNDLMKQGNYKFDENGKMVIEPKFTGIKDGFYYQDGSKYYAGLIEIDGYLYYVKSDCSIVKDGIFWITKTNGLVEKQGRYTFDAEGRMVIETAKNGLYTEGDKTYYYENGAKTYAGLIEIDGYWYYVKSDCSIVKDGIFWITKTNDVVKQGRYAFDAEGRMITE